MSTAAALAVSIILAGCGSTYYFAGRVLPPSGLVNRVLVAIQNPGAAARGALEIMDAHYDTRFKYDNPSKTYSVSGFSGALPITIQNMPEEQIGAVYASGDGSFTMVNYQKEAATGGQSGLPGPSSSIFITRNQQYVVAASQTNSQLTVLNLATGLGASLSLPGVYRVSVNPGGSVFIAFVQNSNYAYYGLELNTSQTLAFSGGPTTWPKAAVDCEPLNVPTWCLFEVQSPDHVDQYGIHYGAPLAFDRPVKAVFSNDGSIAYVLNCGPECGGTASSISLLPTGPMIFLENQQSGKFPVTGTVPNIPITGGASNALIDSTTMYVVGQHLQPDGLFTGNLTRVNLTSKTAGSPISISDGQPGATSRMIEADDNTLWIGMQKCTNGERYAKGLPYGCLTMFNTSTDKVIMLEPYLGDATGIAACTGLHKIYTAEGGQVYIYTTTDGTALNNFYVTVTGTAYDVAYMDGLTDANNTVY
ncbi:MAG: hypothetical protein WCF17_07520 [Terracidiphilus sp.]